jgi:hypothetical protein
MKIPWTVALIAAALVGGWFAGTWQRQRLQNNEGLSSDHTGVTIEQVQELSSLVTTRVDVADAVESRLEGMTGGMKAAMLIKGDFLLEIDLSRGKFSMVDNIARTAVLQLPQPQASSPRLDHERTKVFAVSESGLWQITPGAGQTSAEVIDHGYLEAQRYLAGACEESTLLPRARQHAEQVLAAFFRAIGWSVIIQWESKQSI